VDNEQLLDKVQNLLLGLEERVNIRFDAADKRSDAMDARFDAMDARFDAMDARFDRLETKVDSISRELTLNNEFRLSFDGATG
jgi:hypothetical protein